MAIRYTWDVSTVDTYPTLDCKADEGLIAQEVKEIVPNAVSGSEDEHYQMDYSKLVTPLVKAVQELEQQVTKLKSEIAKLKGE